MGPRKRHAAKAVGRPTAAEARADGGAGRGARRLAFAINAVTALACVFFCARQARRWKWRDDSDTRLVYGTIHGDGADGLHAMLAAKPALARIRAGDGEFRLASCLARRGPLWWAYESDRPDLAKLLVSHGASEAALDA
ncbi:hypothetical protein M885DRAFT_581146 [Pelagophyceae sp. CCMP2097]|nr:hypothetical protein M885DRAFT_581146 [Pelagophyceae sp. CCMP2097]